ncbi:MAG: thioredoxin family protein [Halanaerobiales bacterium]|nr:thioredoxin family protein [Halanaerobiales bacterium]
MPKIKEEEQEKIKELFESKMEDDVYIQFFSSEDDCQYCNDTEEILDELEDLSDKINIQKNELGNGNTEKYGIDRVPAILFTNHSGNDSGVHFYGIPSGHEFNTLIEGIVSMSNGKTQLTDEIIEELKKIEDDILLQVFITPTCPYCPRAVKVAHEMAMHNPKIKGEMVEAIEFPELSKRFQVSGVPKTVINSGAGEQVGAVPAKTILNKIKTVIQ